MVKKRHNNRYKLNYVKPVILEYKLDINVINTLKKCIFSYDYQKADDNWRKFVYNNRNNGNLCCEAQHNLDLKYDYVQGLLADGIMEDIKLMSIEDFLKTIKPIGTQISLHTPRALECLACEGVIHYEKNQS